MWFGPQKNCFVTLLHSVHLLSHEYCLITDLFQHIIQLHQILCTCMHLYRATLHRQSHCRQVSKYISPIQDTLFLKGQDTAINSVVQEGHCSSAFTQHIMARNATDDLQRVLNPDSYPTLYHATLLLCCSYCAPYQICVPCFPQCSSFHCTSLNQYLNL